MDVPFHIYVNQTTLYFTLFFIFLLYGLYYIYTGFL